MRSIDMDFTEFSASADDEERRLDRILRRILGSSSLSKIYKIIRKNLVLVNNKKVSADFRIKNGDKIKIASFLFYRNVGVESGAKNYIFPYKIVFQNEYVLIIEKPYGKCVHGKADSIEKDVVDFYNATHDNFSLSFKPGPLHRLDKNTSGLLCFSQNLKGAKVFSRLLASHKIKKTYIGIAEGHLENEETWKDFILNEKTKKANFFTVKSAVHDGGFNDKNAKIAITKAKPLSYKKIAGQDVTIIEYQIETGRTHQIRFQTSWHGFPLLGDTAYGGKKTKDTRDFFLHAQKLEFPENEIGLPRVVESLQEQIAFFSNFTITFPK